jgi:hypothetical protein
MLICFIVYTLNFRNLSITDTFDGLREYLLLAGLTIYAE